MYTPNNWVVVKVTGNKIHYRILAGWSGGYLHGDSWRMNSGITRVEKEGDYFLFYGKSGSCYKCHKNSYGLRANNDYIWNTLRKQEFPRVWMVSEDTDWLSMNWEN